MGSAGEKHHGEMKHNPRPWSRERERKSRAVFVQVAGGPVVAAVLPWSRRVVVQALSF